MKKLFLLTFAILIASAAYAAEFPGVMPTDYKPNENGPIISSLYVVATEVGLISWSIDGLGTNNTTGLIQVEKPAGATVAPPI